MEKRYPRTVMATACIPWDEKYRFREDLFRREVRHLVAAGIRSIYLFGTAGEGYAVDDELFTRIVTVFADEMDGPELLPMVGIISLSLPQIISRTKRCIELGIRDIQFSFPSWGALSDREVDRFLDEVLGRFHECRFMHYNNGPRCRKLLTIGDYDRLWPRYPNLAAVKFPGLSNIEDIMDIMDSDNPIQFFPLEGGYAHMSMLGECGLLISYLNLSYQTAWQYFEAGVNRDRQAMERVTADIGKVREVFSRTLPMDRIDGAYDKLFVKAAIPEFSQRLYPPYEGVTDGQFGDFMEGLRQAVPHWFSV